LNFLSLGVTAEALRAKIDRKSAISLQRGQFDAKFQVEGGRPPPMIDVMHWVTRSGGTHNNLSC